MSNYLAIATVTAALRQLLLPAVQTAVPGADVTLARPHAGTADASSAESANVNLYLYQVTPNAAFRNVDLPTRGSEGRLAQRPGTGFDLHYLLTFYGSQKNLEPERLLGNVLKTLHERPLLGRQMLGQLVSDPGSAYPDLNRSDLHRAPELVKFRPLFLSLEELSKLWSVFLQTPYTLSAAYVGSVILIESDSEPASVLPVRSRQIFVDALHRPFIERVQADGDSPAMLLAGSRLCVYGRQLRGEESTQLRLDGTELAPTQVGGAHIELDLASVPAADLHAGIQSVQVVHYRASGATRRLVAESNVVPVMLHPLIAAVTLGVTTTHDALRDVEIAFDVSPPLAPGQAVALLLNGTGAAATTSYAFTLVPPLASTGHVESTLRGLAPGEYLLRLKVDGALSPLATGSEGRYNAPCVNIV